MPANIAHMLIAHKALEKLRQKGVEEYSRFAEMLDDASADKNYRAYMNLGSMGPDLYYYSSMAGAVKDMILEGFVQAAGVTPWSYHLHSLEVNKFPLNLVEVIFTDADRRNEASGLEASDIGKLAYIAGHLTHIAADQIIHPLVNTVAGPYYRSGDNRKKHRECEVFQDYFLYEGVYRLEEKSGDEYDFFKQDFRGWADCVRGMTTRNTQDWFRYFLQRGFVETYGMYPSEDDIENSVDGLLLTLRACRTFGPYKKAAKEYRRYGEDSPMYRQYIKDLDYIRHYRLAVELAVVYLIALYEVYFTLNTGGNFTALQRKRFLDIVSDADLSCPLEKEIFEKAQSALESKHKKAPASQNRIINLVNKTTFVTREEIFTAGNDKDAVIA